MRRFRDIPIRQKFLLILALASAIAAVAALTAVLVYEEYTFRPRALENQGTQANILAEILAPALRADDSAAASRYLQTRRFWPEVSAAAAYTTNRIMFAQFTREDRTAAPPEQPPPFGMEFKSGALISSTPILSEGHLAGYLWLRRELPPWYVSFPQYGIMLGAGAIYLLILAALLVYAQKQSISEPIGSLVRTALAVTKNHDYHLRAVLRGRDEIGHLTEAFNQMLTDIEERDVALRESEHKLADAQRLAHVGHWEFDPKTEEIVWSDENYRNFGLKPQDQPMNLAKMRNLIHPEDREKIAQAITGALQGGPRYDVEYRVVLAGGEVRTIHSQGDVTFDKAGHPRRMFGAAQDVTATRRAEEALRKSEALYRSVVTGMAEGVVVQSASGEITAINPAAERIEGRSAEQMVGRTSDDSWWVGIHEDGTPFPGECHPAMVALQTGEPQKNAVMGIRRPDGTRKWISINSQPLIAAEGERPYAVVTTFHDITEIKRAEQERSQHLLFFENLDKVNRAIQGADNLERLTGDVLDALLSIFDCDRAWLLYPCDPNASSWRVPMERTRPEYPGVHALGLSVPMDEETAGVFRIMRAANGPVKFGPEFEHALPSKVAEKYGIQSQIAMAIYPKGSQPYMFGLHQCSRPRVWTPEEERLMQEIGRRLADALTSLLTHHGLLESERRQRLALQVGRIGTFELDIQTRQGTWTRELTEIWGIPDGFTGDFAAYCWQHTHPEDRAQVEENFAQMMLNRNDTEMEFRLIRPNGAIRWVRWRSHVFQDTARGYVRVVGVNMDITEHKEAEEALQESRVRLELANRATRIGPWDWDLRNNRVVFSAEWKRQIGYEEHEISGQYEEWESRLHPEDRDRVLAVLHDYLAGKEPDYEVEFRLRHKDGSYRWIFTRGEVVRDKDGKPLRMFGCHVDITERRCAEDALRRSQQAYSDLVNTIDGIVWEADAQTFQFQFVSQQAERLLGYRAEQWVQEPTFWKDHLHPDDREWAVNFCVGATNEKRDHEFRYRMMAADGRVVWLHDLVTVVLENGRPSKLRGFMADITQFKRGEEALELFRALLDRTNDSIEVIDPETGRFLDVNEKACQTHGYSREEFLALEVPDVEVKFDISSRERWRRNVGDIRQHGFKILQGEHRRKDGSIFPVEINASYIHLDRDYIVSVVRDITERKQAEVALQLAEEKYRGIFENATEGIFQTSPSGALITANPALARMFGYSSPTEMAACVTNVEKQLYVDPLRRAEYKRLLEEKDTVTAFEFEAYRRDASKIWVTVNARAVRESPGVLTHYEGMIIDITERKLLENQLRQAQKMEAVGQLAGGVAHDFNNILTVINGHASLLLNDPELTPEAIKSVEQLYTAGERAANLTRQLLAFSRKQVMRIQPVDLNAVIGELARMLHRLIGENISLELKFRETSPAVPADAGMLEQVVLNLVVNARDAMPRGGKLFITAEEVKLTEAHVRRNSESRPGTFIRLTVRDTGCGIAPEVMPHIFEPFFTTKDVGQGTGLGLATVFGIVKQHQGWIEVESQVGQGAAFHVYLPALPKAEPAASKLAEFKVAGGTETILLVEDELAVRKLAGVILRRYGYQVLECGCGAEALQLWENHPGDIDLLLTDIVMPGEMTGLELAQTLLAKKPLLKVIYTSGYSQTMTKQGNALPTRSNFLAKPYVPATLAKMVRDTLDHPAVAV